MQNVTHKHLVQAAGVYLRKAYPIVFCEVVTWSSQIPDAIAFNTNHSTLIECKTSRSDFMRDRKKPHQKIPKRSMGNYRWYLTAGSLVSVDELPLNWGLLEFHNGKVKRIWHAKAQESNLANERMMLVSALRRGLPVCAANRKPKEKETTACLF